MLIRYTEGKARETRHLVRVSLAIVTALFVGFAFVHISVAAVWAPLAVGVGLIALSSTIAEIRTRRVLARAGKPALDFGDRAVLF